MNKTGMDECIVVLGSAHGGQGSRRGTGGRSTMKIFIMFSVLILALAAWPARHAAADDETANTEIQMHAPLAATDGGATPPAPGWSALSFLALLAGAGVVAAAQGEVRR